MMPELTVFLQNRRHLDAPPRGIPLRDGDSHSSQGKRPRMKCILCNQTTAGMNWPFSSWSVIRPTKVLRSRQRQLRCRFEAVLPAVTVEAPNPTKVDAHSSRRDIGSSPNSGGIPRVQFECVRPWIHSSHDVTLVVVACLYYPEHVTNSIHRCAPENHALRINPHSR